MNYPSIFASPDFSGVGILLAVVGSALPIFLIGAFKGLSVVPGIIQGIYLLVMLAIAWRITRGVSRLKKSAVLLCVYFLASLSFVLLFFVTIPLRVAVGLKW
jgi:hypothetical protein